MHSGMQHQLQQEMNWFATQRIGRLKLNPGCFYSDSDPAPDTMPIQKPAAAMLNSLGEDPCLVLYFKWLLKVLEVQRLAKGTLS